MQKRIFMWLIKKIKNLFRRKKKLNTFQNNLDGFSVVTPSSLASNNDNFMPYVANIASSASTFDASWLMSRDDVENEARQYKAQRDEKLKTFKANKPKAKTKAEKEAEKKEVEWIKDIIRIAKQPKQDGKTA